MNIIKPIISEAKIGSSIIKNVKVKTEKKDSAKFKDYKTNVPFDYIYWDDPNELVNRLQLLYASQQSGNDVHNNEIISIIENDRIINRSAETYTM